MATYHDDIQPHRGYQGCFYATTTLNADKLVLVEHNTACTICLAPYFDESGCDPCPQCGASYGSQIWHEEGVR